MPVVNLNIGGRKVQLSCGENEEEHLLGLAKALDSRMQNLGANYKDSNDKILLVMTALMMQDELNELAKKTLPAAANKKQKSNINSQYLNEVSGKINLISEYMEDLAEKLEKC